ncbi:EAL domain-containing protein [Novosphingobium flavum]|uniref:EAL domain-containing protein n=1 Tax=Novosphingobium aerophilum TaxID=2839843 RepID=A0A7X1F5U6_9SPHN|nr:EAL domain-containing protein [Novosphingobium aerophilum]MBC2650888.1 EAL domain-containing protein [Novosphingobium aerophilum]MBC2663625.1 EAL domain-containing protein [Novosphingobium aerophilum]
MFQDWITTVADSKFMAKVMGVPVDIDGIATFVIGMTLGIAATLGLAGSHRAAVLRPWGRWLDQASSAGRASSTGGSPGSLGPAIKAAIRTGELQLHYQPKLDCRTSKICGAEALSRWTLPDGTALSPQEFVAQAETVGGISDLTVWTIERALRDAQELDADKLGGAIFVNLSARLVTSQFTERLIALAGTKACRLGLEITETAVLDNPEEALHCLNAMRDAGIALAIDDYGAGLSSLSYLKQIPAEELKIDQKFIRGITRSHRDPMIVRSTIDLCHGLGMKVTAEGVEDQMTASLLGVMGCDMIQGYFISKARPLEGLRQFIEQEPTLALQVPKIRKRVGT